MARGLDPRGDRDLHDGCSQQLVGPRHSTCGPGHGVGTHAGDLRIQDVERHRVLTSIVSSPTGSDASPQMPKTFRRLVAEDAWPINGRPSISSVARNSE